MPSHKNQNPVDMDDFEDEEETKKPSSYDQFSKSLGRENYESLEEKLNETEQKLNEALAALEEAKTQQVRSLAEVDNVRKRAEKDIRNAHMYGVERLIIEILPVIDSLERGLSIQFENNEFAKKMHEGLEMTLNLFLDTLKKFSVTPVNPLGEAFNPSLHQAISMQEDPAAQPNTVLQVLQKGYLLHDRLIRPALVIVAKP